MALEIKLKTFYMSKKYKHILTFLPYFHRMLGWRQERTSEGHLADHEPIEESDLWVPKHTLQIAGESLRCEDRLQIPFKIYSLFFSFFGSFEAKDILSSP